MPRVRAAKHPAAGGPSTSSRPAPAPDPAADSSSMPVKRPLPQRAASSAPALPPTPPRTTHKRKRRSRSRVTDSSSEDEDDHDVPEPASDKEDDRGSDVRKLGGVAVGNKRRKTMTLDAIAEELSEARAEEQFWLGENKAESSAAGPSTSGQSRNKASGSRPTTHARSRTRSPSSSPPPAPHLLRRGHTGLFSPPPSRRAPAVVPRLATPPPTTHKAKAKEKKATRPVFPERDSPNNPFLEDSPGGSIPATDSSPEPRTPKKHVEKPTITMVFRGVKTEMLNPHYVSEEAAAEQEARARLPVTHPDYSPTDACAPKLLFPEARRHDLARRRAHSPVPVPTSPTPTSSKRTRAGSASSSEGAGPATKKVVPAAAPGAPGPSKQGEEDDAEVMSAVLAANIARRMRKGVLADGDAPRTRPSSRSREVPQLPEKDRSDPIKRALGPARRG